jgi:signal peptidase II
MNELSETQQNQGSGNRAFILWLALAGLIVVLDQLTKLAILKWVGLYEKIAVNSFINITHHRNTGAAFSFLADAGGWQRWFFTVLAIVVSGIITIWIYRQRREGPVILLAGLSLVLGGAIGNVIDRVRLGYVVDFIQVLLAGWPFPSFNVADSAITVGAILLLIDALFFTGKKTPAPTE